MELEKRLTKVENELKSMKEAKKKRAGDKEGGGKESGDHQGHDGQMDGG
jgi:hypothetical protein